MNFQLDLNKISISPAGVVSDLTPYLKKAMEVAEKWLIDLMAEAIDETSTAPHDWRDSLKADLKHVEDVVSKSMIEYVAGVDYQPESSTWMRAMVIAYGMGKLGLNGNEIMAGPLNRIVWNWDLTHLIPSNVETEHEIPESWYHAGGWFIHNAITNMRVIFKDAIEESLSDLPASALHDVFYRNLTIKKR